MRRLLIIALLVTHVSLLVNADTYDHDIAILKKTIANDSAQARHMGENILRKDKKNPDLAAAIGRAFLQVGRIEDAEYFYDKGYHMYRISPTIINLAGDIALSKNDKKQAEYYYKRAIYFNKRAPEGYFKYANLYAKTEPEKAIEQLKILKQYRRNLDVDLKIAGIYYENTNFSKAATLYACIPSDSLDKETLTNYALSYYFQQKFDSALTVAHEGIRRYPRHPALNRMLLYNNTELKNYDIALEAADKLFNQSDNAHFQYLDYLYYGYALNGKGKYDEAIAQFNRVVELNPDRTDAVKAVSEAYEKIGDYSHAIAYYQQYLDKLDPDEQTSYKAYHLGNLYYAMGTDSKQGKELTPEKMEALYQADKQFEKVEQMRPDSYVGPYWRARTNVALDPTSEKGLAKPHYMKVISLLTAQGDKTTSQLLESYKYLTYYYYLKQDKASCHIYIDKIMKIDPNDSYALKISNAL